jgi:hypothetical protein
MPRYFFSVHDGVDVPDVDGTVLASLDEAREQAVIAAGEAIKDLGQTFWEGDHQWQMQVTDESGATLCLLNFSAQR